MIKILPIILIVLVYQETLTQDLVTIKAEQIDKESDIYENSIDSYKTSEFWGIWTMPIGDAFATSELKSQGQINYSIENISDYDLITAWIGGKTECGFGERFLQLAYFAYTEPSVGIKQTERNQQ
jgi:hypothetical protein